MIDSDLDQMIHGWRDPDGSLISRGAAITLMDPMMIGFWCIIAAALIGCAFALIFEMKGWWSR